MGRSVRAVVVFHRGLGTDDESASSDESHERVLYHFVADDAGACPPPVHDDGWANGAAVEREQRRQLSTLSLLEGLIEFARKLSGEDVPAQTVRMREQTWGLVQVEPSVWVALCVGNEVFQQRKVPSLVDRPGFDLRRFTSLDGDTAAEAAAVAAAVAAVAAAVADADADADADEPSDDADDASSNVDAACLENVLRRVHGLFVCLNGTVGDVLSGAAAGRQQRRRPQRRRQQAPPQVLSSPSSGAGSVLGWERIERVKETRKALRKLGHRLEQLERDVESARGGDADGAGLAKEVASVRGDMAAAEVALAELLCRGAGGADALYAPTVLRRRLTQLIHWCVRSGALLRWMGACAELTDEGMPDSIPKMAAFSGGGSSSSSVGNSSNSNSSSTGGIGRQVLSPARHPAHAPSPKGDTQAADAAALAHAQARMAAARSALEHTLRAVSYLIRYHHASRGAVVLHEDTLLHSDLDDATTALLCELAHVHAATAVATKHLFQTRGGGGRAGPPPAKAKRKGMFSFSGLSGRSTASHSGSGAGRGGGMPPRPDSAGAGFVSGDWTRLLDLTRLPAAAYGVAGRARDTGGNGAGSSAASVNSVASVATGLGSMFFGHPHQASPMRPPAPGTDDHSTATSVASTPAKGVGAGAGAGSVAATPSKGPAAGAVLLPDEEGDVGEADEIWCRQIYHPRERASDVDVASCTADEVGRLVIYAQKR